MIQWQSCMALLNGPQSLKYLLCVTLQKNQPLGQVNSCLPPPTMENVLVFSSKDTTSRKATVTCIIIIGSSLL